jgi:hypothetical protein
MRVEAIVKWRRLMIWAWAVLSALWWVSVLVQVYFTRSTCMCDRLTEPSGIDVLVFLAVIVVPPLLVLGAGTAAAWVVRSVGRAYLRSRSHRRSHRHLFSHAVVVVVMLPALVLLHGCGGFQPSKSYEGAERPESKLAVVNCGANVSPDSVIIMDVASGTTVYSGKFASAACVVIGNKIRVAPKQYMISFDACGYKSGCKYLNATVTLKAGHSYWIGGDKCYMFCFSVDSYTEYVWIEDETTGEVLAGHAI